MKRDSQSHGDGVINQLDLIALQQALKGQIPITPGMDCNQDGVVDNKDKSCIAQQIGNYKNHGKGNGSGTGSGGTAAASTATNSLYIYFVYDEAGHLVGEYDQNGNLIAEHIWLNNRPIAVITSTGLYYVQTDQLGTPRAITNASEQLVWEWRSDPFGNGHPNTNPSGIGLFSYNLRFPGQYYDAETGHNYNYFRDYDPTTGRYIESDPIGLAGGLNTYLYGLDSPITNKDVDGLLVLLCNRKLGSPESPPIPGNSSWPLRHEYLVVNGQSFSFQPSGNELLSKGTIQKNIETANSECTKLCDDPAFDKDVLAAIVAIGRPTYCLLAIHGSAYADAGLRNCQTWTEDVLNLAKQQYKKEADADKRCKKCFAKQ